MGLIRNISVALIVIGAVTAVIGLATVAGVAPPQAGVGSGVLITGVVLLVIGIAGVVANGVSQRRGGPGGR